MDRRQALKKIAVGGAVAATGPVILSSPAFAYALPTVTGSPTITLTRTGTATASIAVTAAPTGTCNASSTNTNDQAPPGAPAISWTVTRAEGGTNSGTGPNVTRGGFQWDGYPSFLTGVDTVVVQVDIPYTCSYTGSPGGVTRCVRWTRSFTASGPILSSNVVFNGAAVSAPGSC